MEDIENVREKQLEITKEQYEVKDGKIIIDTEKLEGMDIVGDAIYGEEGANGITVSVTWH